jgi:hypothetical protein
MGAFRCGQATGPGTAPGQAERVWRDILGSGSCTLCRAGRQLPAALVKGAVTAGVGRGKDTTTPVVGEHEAGRKRAP